ncbi:MAG TPA: NrsF family protein [Polyangiaceae bacterium]|nr:NrsF family protein [Polyangiaceae bacterium]
MTSPPDPDLSALFGEIPEPGPASLPSTSALGVPALGASPARELVRKRRLAALTGSAAWLLTHLAVYGVRSDFHGLPVPYVAAQILLPFVVAVASLFAALSYGKLGLGLRIGLLSGLAILGPLAFCLVAFGAPVPYPAGSGAASALGILVCFDITVAWTAVPLLCAVLVLPGAFATGVRWRSALVGAAIGLFAGATMNLHCPNVAPLHVLMGHGLPVLVATVLGALVLAYHTRA